MNECTRAIEMLPGRLDDDLAVDQRAWLDAHLQSCPDCRGAMFRLEEIDLALTEWGRGVARDNPPLVARVRPVPFRWIAAAAAVLIAAAVLTGVAPQRPPAAAWRDPFVAIPYLPPLDPRENTAVVRMNIRVATLIAAGYGVTANPDDVIAADVLVGEDGRAHAVRMLWNEKGDY